MSCSSCSICLNDITRETGVATLSCGHSFHISCINRWSSTPETSTCPMCRNRLGEMESTTPFPVLPQEEEEEAEIVISRDLLGRLLIGLGASAESRNMIDIMFPTQDPIFLNRYDMNVLIMGLAEPVDLALWNGLIELYGMPMEEEAEAEAEEPLAVTWRSLADGRWASGPVVNPEDETGVSVTASGWAEPLLVSAERVEQVAQEAVTKMQEAWRAFRSRVL